MARKLGMDGQAVAYAVLEGLMNEDALNAAWDSCDSIAITHHLIEAAEVEFQPRARKLILTFDLAEPDEPAAPYVDDEPIDLVPADDVEDVAL